MSQIIAFPTPPRREAAAGMTYAGELVAFGRNDIATVIETISLLREGGLGEMLDAFNRGPAVERRARRRSSPTA